MSAPEATIVDDNNSPVLIRALGDYDNFAQWCANFGVKGNIGELGWPVNDDQWNRVAEHVYNAAEADKIPIYAWAAGRWWPEDYKLKPLSSHARTV